MIDFWNQEDWDRYTMARWEGFRDGIAVGVVLTVVFAYVWCHFGWTT